MDAFNEVFVHQPKYRLIVCKRCKYAVNPAQIRGHITANHSTVTKQERQQIIKFVAGLPQIAHTQDEVRYPDIRSAAVAGLPIYTDGMRCTAIEEGQPCHYVCRSSYGIATHCRTAYGWDNPRKRGRPTDDADKSRMWVDKQACQQFFKTGTWQRYFPIQVVPEPSQAPTVGAMEQANTWMEGLFEKFEEARKEDESERSRYEPNPWLEHTGWEKHIRGYKAWVVKQIQDDIADNTSVEITPEEDEDEKVLKKACVGTMVLIRRSFHTSRVEIVGRHALQCVHRRENGAATNDRPFYGKQKVQTIRKYTAVFVKILRYIWRTESTAARPAYRLTPGQKQALVTLRSAARTGQGSAESSPSAVRDQAVAEREKVVTASLAFWIAMFQHPLGDNEYESGLLSGLAVLGGCGEKNGWVPAIYYTPTLAAVITTIRAMVARRAWRTREDHVAVQVQAGMEEAVARQGAPVIHELVQQDVDRFMTITAFGGSPHPMNTIYTQKMYGMKIRYTTNADGQVGWSGDQQDVILVRKIQFSMGQIRELVHGLLDTTRRRLAGELLCMVPGIEDWRPEGLPRIDLSKQWIYTESSLAR